MLLRTRKVELSRLIFDRRTQIGLAKTEYLVPATSSFRRRSLSKVSFGFKKAQGIGKGSLIEFFYSKSDLLLVLFDTSRRCVNSNKKLHYDT